MTTTFTDSGPNGGRRVVAPHDVFISHSAKDKGAADSVCAALESRGVRCWMAPRDVRPGVDWSEAIVDAIERARAVVLVFSSHANMSPQVRREVQLAFERSMAVVPFRIEAVEPTKSMRYYIASLHWLDAVSAPLEAHLDRLVETVRQVLPDDSDAEDAEQPSLSPRLPEPPTASPARVQPVRQPTRRRGRLKRLTVGWWRGRSRRGKVLIVVAALLVSGLVAWWGPVYRGRRAVAYWRGKAFETGRLVAQDDLRAIECYRTAASMGDVDAMATLGRIYRVTDKDEAAIWYLRAASNGHPYSMFVAGDMYDTYHGWDWEANWWEWHGSTYYDRHSGEGPEVRFQVGRPNDAAAESWYRKGAERGDPYATYRLAQMYELGRGGLAKDRVAAASWYRKAAERGHADAKASLERLGGKLSERVGDSGGRPGH